MSLDPHPPKPPRRPADTVRDKSPSERIEHGNQDRPGLPRHPHAAAFARRPAAARWQERGWH